MDADNLQLAAGLVSKSYVAQGSQSLASRHRLVKALLANRRLPDRGWDEATIEMLLQDCSAMDSNNFLGNVGVGEREGRVSSGLVARRHFRLTHGIGRSGDIAAEQPKAAGSSLLSKLTVLLASDALRMAGLQDVGHVAVLPVATGMAMTLTLLATRASRPPGAQYVVWSRIDQKTCLKAITAAGLQPLVVELTVQGDQLCTDEMGIQSAVESVGPGAVVAVISTTSCFAPRASDDVVAIAKLCARLGVPHVINNAYGVQSSRICRDVTAAWRKGRVDCVVQSTDKNFMVPVGGVVLAEGKHGYGVVDAVCKAYPGRAAMAPLLDLLITLLGWGGDGWRKLLAEREELYDYLQEAMSRAADTLGQRVLATPGNPISLAMTLDQGPLAAATNLTSIGSMLWARRVSGTRVVARGSEQSVAGIAFKGYGSHCDQYPHTYLTAAAALGGSREEAAEFCTRLVKCVQEAVAKLRPRPAQQPPTSSEDTSAAALTAATTAAN